MNRIGKIITILLAAFFGYVTVSGIISYFQTKQKIADLRKPPMTMSADLSKIGTYSCNYEQIRVPAHGAELRLEISTDDDKAKSAKVELSDLVATLTISDTQGNIVHKQSLGDTDKTPPDNHHSTGTFMNTRNIPVGSYTAELEVKKPISAVANTPHKLVAHNDICMLPMMCSISTAIALIAFGLMNAMIALTLWLHRRSRKHIQQQEQTENVSD